MATHESTGAVLNRPDSTSDQQADRWLEIFSLFIHDLESPLASVKYVLKLLDERRLEPDSEKHRNLVHASRIALDRAETILYDILSVVRSGSQGLPVRMSSVQVGPSLAEAVLLAGASAEQNNVSVGCSKVDGNVSVQADPELLKRMLDNLLFNAIRHTPAGSQVDVYTETGETSLVIHIKDSGDGLGGIEPHELFEKFGQARLRAEGKHRGVGLGLYFCKLAATGMGGTVFADDHPDGGAVFSILLKKTEE